MKTRGWPSSILWIREDVHALTPWHVVLEPAKEDEHGNPAGQDEWGFTISNKDTSLRLAVSDLELRNGVPGTQLARWAMDRFQRHLEG